MYMAGRAAAPAALSRRRRGGAVSGAGSESVECMAKRRREEARCAGCEEARVAQRETALCIGGGRLVPRVHGRKNTVVPVGRGRNAKTRCNEGPNLAREEDRSARPDAAL